MLLSISSKSCGVVSSSCSDKPMHYLQDISRQQTWGLECLPKRRFVPRQACCRRIEWNTWSLPWKRVFQAETRQLSKPVSRPMHTGYHNWLGELLRVGREVGKLAWTHGSLREARSSRFFFLPSCPSFELCVNRTIRCSIHAQFE